MRVLRALGASALVLALAAGCNGDDSSDDAKPPVAESATLADLRSAKGCPLQVDESTMPPSLRPTDKGYVYSDVSVDQESELVQVVCKFPVSGAGKRAEPVTVSVAALPDGDRNDLLAVDSFGNLIFNETGVEMGELTSTVNRLVIGQVETLQGNGEFLAVRRVEIDGASSALVLVYGPDGLSEDDLLTAAVATTW